jgi:hypothetical protein
MSDIDLDSPEIAAVIGRFVPTNTLAIGRGGVASYFLYAGEMPNHESMKDLDGHKMVEVRLKGKQVMWADSIHPDTDQKIEVMNDVAPLPVPDEEDVLKAYTAAVIAKYLPGGDRHTLALEYAGYLLRKGLSEDDVYATWKPRGIITTPPEKRSTTSLPSWPTPHGNSKQATSE